MSGVFPFIPFKSVFDHNYLEEHMERDPGLRSMGLIESSGDISHMPIAVQDKENVQSNSVMISIMDDIISHRDISYLTSPNPDQDNSDAQKLTDINQGSCERPNSTDVDTLSGMKYERLKFGSYHGSEDESEVFYTPTSDVDANNEEGWNLSCPNTKERLEIDMETSKYSFDESIDENRLSSFLMELVLNTEDHHGNRYTAVTEVEQKEYKSTKILTAADKKVFFKLDNVDFTGHKLRCLSATSWLSDEIINGYMRLLQERDKIAAAEGYYPKCHFFKSFFCNKLILEKGYQYEEVRKWTSPRKLQNWGQRYSCILECDILFIPIHLSNHWVLAAAFIKEKKIRYFDSLLGERRDVTAALVQYITDEAKDKLKQDWVGEDWRIEYPKEIPLQENGHDCGVFVLQYAKYLSAGKKLSFTQNHMKNFRVKIMSELLQKNISL